MPSIKIEVEKPLGTFYLDRGKEAPWSSEFKIGIEKSLNGPRIQGREAPLIPSIQIKVEKPLSHPQFKIVIEKPLNRLGSKVEKPLGYLPSRLR